MRIALANIHFARTPHESVELAKHAILKAEQEHADVICFPECYVPGLRGVGKEIPPPDERFLKSARSSILRSAELLNVSVVMGTERIVDEGLRATAMVVTPDGVGWQDKVQLDPLEDRIYSPGAERHLFQVGELKFGVAICHEGWRYPETVRWAAARGAHLVFLPHFSEAEPGSYRATEYGDPANTFHEKAVLCRAAENTCYIASVNYASPGSPTTSAVVRPDGTLQCYQPYGVEGLLMADIDLSLAIGLLAKRLRSYE